MPQDRDFNLPDPTPTQRFVNPAAEAVLGKAFPVLDKGFVRLVEYMGTDASIVQAARVSYGKGTKKVSEDEGLIRYLMRHRHTTPFEMCELKFHVRVPMDCWRQWIRHRTANVNEYSTRYSLAIDDKQKTGPLAWRLQSADNKQGSGGFASESLGTHLSAREEKFHTLADELYQERIDRGVAKEQARKDLPLSTYTEAYWKIDLHNLFHFLGLRMDSHAQYEIRMYANVIGQSIVREVYPMAWRAFEDYVLNAVVFTGPEIAFLKRNDFDRSISKESIAKLISDSGLFGKREEAEFLAKLTKLELAGVQAMV